MMLFLFKLILIIAIVNVDSFLINHLSTPFHASTTTPSSTSIRSTNSMTIDEASGILKEWDSKTGADKTASDEDGILPDLQKQLPEAILFLNSAATAERTQDSTKGRCMLGICGKSPEEAIAALKAWVTALELPRGLLHGMDKDGVPLQLEGGVYIKYNSGGVTTFSDIKKSGLGFDALWKPGDALLEPYDGDYHGVYFQVELEDGEFRQYFVPLDTF